jgi:hypothetical protein
MAVIDTDPTKIRALMGGSIMSQKIANVAMAYGNLVYPIASRKVALCDANTLATVSGMIGVVVAGGPPRASGVIAALDPVSILWFGRLFLGDDIALTENASLYVSDTAGEFDDAAGTIERRVAVAEEPNIVVFDGIYSVLTS